jgi:hypothetical protein
MTIDFHSQIKQTSKYDLRLAIGYWNDTRESFEHVIALDSWDGIEDDDDREVFYFFDGDDPIGDHGEFTITKLEQV